MSRTKRHIRKNYYKNGELIDSQWIPQNKASKEYTKRDIQVPNIGGRAYNGHKHIKGINRMYSGILRAKLKNELRNTGE